MTALSLLLICIAYLSGSLMGALLVNSILRKADPRQTGSGNPGATNMLRSHGKWPAIFTLLIDVIKGIVPVLIGMVLNQNNTVLGLIALFACIGHMYPLYYGFSGGKGVATTLGVIAPLSANVASGLVGLWIIVFGLSRYSSLASIVSTLSALPLSYYFAPDFMFPIGIMSILILIKHKDNIQNLFRGTERRFPVKDESD